MKLKDFLKDNLIVILATFENSISVSVFQSYDSTKKLKLSLLLKVSKSQKQILKLSFETKIERKYFCISPLAVKGIVRESKKILQLAVLSIFFYLTSF